MTLFYSALQHVDSVACHRESLAAIRARNAPYSHIPSLRVPSEQFLASGATTQHTMTCSTHRHYSKPPPEGTQGGAMTARELPFAEENDFLLPIVHWRKSTMRAERQKGSSQNSWRGLRRVRTSSLIQNIASSANTMRRQQGDLLFNEKQKALAGGGDASIPGWCSDLLESQSTARGPAKTKRMGSIWLAGKVAGKVNPIHPSAVMFVIGSSDIRVIRPRRYRKWTRHKIDYQYTHVHDSVSPAA